MPVFTTWKSYRNFWQVITHESRYVWTNDIKEFLATVAETCSSRLLTIPAGRIFWRAQLAHDWRKAIEIDEELPWPCPPDRMKPWADRAREGRANPKGIPCLYLATTRDTAMSEVRPWVGSLVSVAQFQTIKDLTIVNCSVHQGGFVMHFEEPDSEEIERTVWAHIDGAFSEPVTSSDDIADYAATQVLAGLFRSKGYNGVAYKSAFGEKGFNLALFDIDAARQLNCLLCKTKEVSYGFEETGDEYFVKEPDK